MQSFVFYRLHVILTGSVYTVVYVSFVKVYPTCDSSATI